MDQNTNTPPQEESFWSRVNIMYLLRWAFTGFMGTVIGLIGVGLILEFIIDWSVSISGGRGASLIIVVGIMAAVFGYPLVGAIIGVVLGIRKLKYDLPKRNINEYTRGLVVGLITGTVFYILLFLIAILSMP